MVSGLMNVSFGIYFFGKQGPTILRTFIAL
jgi:hypothetical protein